MPSEEKRSNQIQRIQAVAISPKSRLIGRAGWKGMFSPFCTLTTGTPPVSEDSGASASQAS